MLHAKVSGAGVVGVRIRVRAWVVVQFCWGHGYAGGVMVRLERGSSFSSAGDPDHSVKFKPKHTLTGATILLRVRVGVRVIFLGLGLGRGE